LRNNSIQDKYPTFCRCDCIYLFIPSNDNNLLLQWQWQDTYRLEMWMCLTAC
jgi:hypothetical protein